MTDPPSPNSLSPPPPTTTAATTVTYSNNINSNPTTATKTDNSNNNNDDDDNTKTYCNINNIIPIEIISEEVMRLVDAAFIAARSSFTTTTLSLSPPPNTLHSSSASSPSLLRNRVKSIASITSLSKRRLSTSPPRDGGGNDIEDLKVGKQKRRGGSSSSNGGGGDKSLLMRFRKNSGLFVTDFTATEWCEKQMEFRLKYGRRKPTKAMEAGTARHAQLEEEVGERVGVPVQSREDIWAVKFLSFLNGVNQLLLEGLTRELPLVGFVDGLWMVGKVDEVRLPKGEMSGSPILVDTKTRVWNSPPAEPQRRNGRLQLMCYKLLWDNLVQCKFPSKKFLDFFCLNPYHILSEGIRESTARAGIPAKTLDGVLRYYIKACSMLLPANNEMLLRYELQKDNSLITEDRFDHDPDWVKSQIQRCLEVWSSKREANYVAEEERWKCHHCQYANICPINNPGTTPPDVCITSPPKQPN